MHPPLIGYNSYLQGLANGIPRSANIVITLIFLVIFHHLPCHFVCIFETLYKSLLQQFIYIVPHVRLFGHYFNGCCEFPQRFTII